MELPMTPQSALEFQIFFCFSELGHRITEISGDKRESTYANACNALKHRLGYCQEHVRLSVRLPRCALWVNGAR